MNTLRNLNGFTDSPIIPGEIRREEPAHTFNDNGGLSGFHHFEEAEEGSGKAKMIGGALVVALLLGATGIYAYTGSGTKAAHQAPAASVASNMAAPIQTAPVAQAAPSSEAASSTPSPYDAAADETAKTVSSDTDSAQSDVKPVNTARGPAKDSERNAAGASQTAELNKDSSAADRATQNGSVAVPMPAAPSSSVAETVPVDNSAAMPLPAPPAPPAASLAANGQTSPTTGEPTQDAPAAQAVAPEAAPAAPVTPAPQADPATPAQPQ